MAKLDLILFIIFGTFAVCGLCAAVFSIRKAMRVACEKEGELRMFFWAVAAMIGLIVSGVSTAYILLPILYNL